MKKCPRCAKTYDDSWGICLHCETRLIQAENGSVQEPIKQEDHPKIILSASQKALAGILACVLVILLLIIDGFIILLFRSNKYSISTGEIIFGIGSVLPSLFIGLFIGVLFARGIKTYKLPWILNRINLVLIITIITSIVIPILRYVKLW